MLQGTPRAGWIVQDGGKSNDHCRPYRQQFFPEAADLPVFGERGFVWRLLETGRYDGLTVYLYRPPVLKRPLNVLKAQDRVRIPEGFEMWRGSGRFGLFVAPSLRSHLTRRYSQELQIPPIMLN